MVKYCKRNFQRYFKIWIDVDSQCDDMCIKSLRFFIQGGCDCHWHGNEYCYNYMYCWNKGIIDHCTLMFDRNYYGELCFLNNINVIIPEYKNHLYKAEIGDIKYKNKRYNGKDYKYCYCNKGNYY
ncbi:hypothetical protein PIROE2DRAFT_14926 [Piromyces sp. E2]|nr:hypothetical protein PIROE2DRAFT_14926 [Piromyces sp. E2]|eukprot:OUM59518.1 hypothetical protein PIROE2DRAFT_14926 [Piromyces sp. E2]